MKPLIYAHRGYSGKYPENTMIAFEKAIEAGCDGIELDVHLSKDGEVMVTHDFTVDRMTDSHGRVVEYTKNELQKMKISGSGVSGESYSYIPTLEEVFELLYRYSKKNIQFNIELKAGSRMYSGIENKVAEMIYRYDYLNKTIVSSFDHESLYIMKEIDSRIKTGVLSSSAMYKPWDYIKMIKGDYYHPNYMTLDNRLIEESVYYGIPLNVYTVNDHATISRLLETKVNGIITNYPEYIPPKSCF